MQWTQETWFDPSGRSPGEGNGNSLQCSCLEKFHGQRSLVCCSPWDRKESDTTERLKLSVNDYFEIHPCCSVSSRAVHSVDTPLFLYTLTSHWAVSTFWQLQTKLLWTRVYRSLYGRVLCFSLGKRQGVRWLGHMVGACFTLRNCQTISQRNCTIFNLHDWWEGDLVPPHTQHMSESVSEMSATLQA